MDLIQTDIVESVPQLEHQDCQILLVDFPTEWHSYLNHEYRFKQTLGPGQEWEPEIQSYDIRLP